MPGLSHTLRQHDMSALKNLASLWGIDLSAYDFESAVASLQSQLTSSGLFHEIRDSLPDEAKNALEYLQERGGLSTIVQFTRNYGELRVMGVARRERERPDLAPVSAFETLWYRGLVGKAILDIQSEPEEYVYIPDEFLHFLQPVHTGALPPIGRPASSSECAFPLEATDRILDHMTSLLAALRSGKGTAPAQAENWQIPLPVLMAFSKVTSLLDDHDMPIPEPTRTFLEAPRSQALSMIVACWKESPVFNELWLMPGLKCEGEWKNDPLKTRAAVLRMLSRIPGTTWWSLSGFIQAVQREDPDFQRPAGDYESWFIRDRQSGSFLHGFSSWETVDGGLLRFFMTGILHWLGIVSLASPSQEAEPEAFRITDWAADLLVGKPPSGLPAEAGKIKLVSNGKVVMPRLTPRAVHYQIARFCDWEKETVRDYHYRITHESLARAKAQGLKIEQILGLLVRNSAAPPPPNIRKALERWDEHGVQASLETRTILHVYDPHQIELLRKSRASRYLDEQLNPTTILLRPGGNAVVGEVLAEIGFLAEDRTENRDASA